MVQVPKLTNLDATQINQAASNIMMVDGDRDHMNRSNLTCEQTQSIAKFLYAIARYIEAQPT